MINFQKLGWLIFAFVLLANTSGVSAQDDKVELEALLEGAKADINAGDTKSGEEKLLKYTQAIDDNSEAWFFLGYSLHLNGKLDEAIKAHEKAVTHPEYGPIAIYNLGCAYSLKNDTAKSLKYLHQCLDKGFNQYNKFDEDADLANVRKVDGFSEILERASNGGARITKRETQPLVGKWAIKSGTLHGEKIDTSPEPMVITFTAKEVTIPSADEPFVMSYKMIGDKSDDGVVKIDFKIESGPGPQGSAKAIMKMDGKTAKLCYDPTGKKRPEKFETSEENGFFLFVMERKIKKDVTDQKKDGQPPAEDKS